jgi:hypothetical protein
MQFQVAAPVFTIGWILALLALVLVVVFAFVGLPDPKAVLFLIGLVAVARLL